MSLDGQSQFWLSGSTYAGSDVSTVTPTSSGNTGGVYYTTGQPGTPSVQLYNAYPVQALTVFTNGASSGLYVGVSLAHWLPLSVVEMVQAASPCFCRSHG